jgi:LmbE family N-acetylglucosaminyl deacetylase
MKLKLNKEKILIVVAHPDDEVLGCGGYLSKYKNLKEFKILFIGEGTSCRFLKNKFNIKMKHEITKRQKQSIQSLKYLGIKNYEYHNLPCGRFNTIDIIDINKIIEKNIQKFKPNIIFTHNANDCNNDHRIVNRSVMMASRPVINNKYLKDIITFEIISSTEWNFESQFSPNYFETLSEKNLMDKIKAFNFYKSEIQSGKMPRTNDGLKTLAKYRGKIISTTYAESFQIIRKIDH